MTANQLFYRARPIGSLHALASAVGVSEEELRAIALRADSYYELAQEIIKDDGRIRRVYRVLQPLRSIQDRILARILRSVEYPNYLMGGIADPNHCRGYVRNAQRHAGSKLLIGADIADFFPSIPAEKIRAAVQHVLHFSPDVASVVAKLCTYNGYLPQGAPPSTYLANLVLYRREPELVAELESSGFRYSRLVDDVHVSTLRTVSPRTTAAVVRSIRQLFERDGYRAKREKQEIGGRGRQRTIHNLNVDGQRATVPLPKRKSIRSAVFQLERRAKGQSEDASIRKDLQRTMGRVASMVPMHATEAHKLKLRLQRVQALFGSQASE